MTSPQHGLSIHRTRTVLVRKRTNWIASRRGHRISRIRSSLQRDPKSHNQTVAWAPGIDATAFCRRNLWLSIGARTARLFT